jgi:FkbM family methyltransferase
METGANGLAPLVYDVGLHEAQDTAFYLYRGMRVIAIEADPVLSEKAGARFAREIGEGRLTILNVGISASEGEAIFYKSLKYSVWNSFKLEIANRDNGGYTEVRVRTRRFADILREHGTPAYAKIDIEGNDVLCLRDMAETAMVPRHLSVEAECVGDSATDDGAPGLATLKMLRDLGYRQFKLVDQESLLPFSQSPLWRDRAEKWVQGTKKIPYIQRRRAQHWIQRLSYRAGLSRRLGYSFTHGGSGPWGEEIECPWATFEQACAYYNEARAEHFSDPNAPSYSFWFDWHAKLDFDPDRR